MVIGSDSDLRSATSSAVERPAAPLPERGWDPTTALESLTVVDDGISLAKTAYDRDFFGQRWLDVERNGCDTRIICIREASQS